jgi:translation initiation factor 1
MAKNKSAGSAVIYSTDPGFKYQEEEAEKKITLAPEMQPLKVKLETKQRAGKAVTLIQGFVGTEGDADELGKKLKSFCGTGGTVKESEILVQGDNRDKIIGWLQKNGYKMARKI